VRLFTLFTLVGTVLGIALAGAVRVGRGRCSLASSNDALPEAGRMNADILDARETRMAAPTVPSTVSAPRSCRCAAISAVGFVSAFLIISESYPANCLGAVRRGSVVCRGRSPDDYLRQDICCGAILICSIREIFVGYSFLFVAVVVMELAVIVSVVVIMFVAVSVGMTVSAEHEEAKEVGEEAGAADNEDELRVGDFGRLDESRQGFEDDGNAERN
jgi:hypothetical protein